MKKKISLFLLLIITPFIISDSFSVELGGSSSREGESGTTESNITKIDPKIIEWQNAPNPRQYALDNNLSSDNDKIAIFIYLDDSNSISNIPSQIEITGSDQNVVVAIVSSEEINQLAQLDFVQKITLPKLVKPHSIPSVTTNVVDYSIILILGAIFGIIIVIILIIKARARIIKNNAH